MIDKEKWTKITKLFNRAQKNSFLFGVSSSLLFFATIFIIPNPMSLIPFAAMGVFALLGGGTLISSRFFGKKIKKQQKEIISEDLNKEFEQINESAKKIEDLKKDIGKLYDNLEKTLREFEEMSKGCNSQIKQNPDKVRKLNEKWEQIDRIYRELNIKIRQVQYIAIKVKCFVNCINSKYLHPIMNVKSKWVTELAEKTKNLIKKYKINIEIDRNYKCNDMKNKIDPKYKEMLRYYEKNIKPSPHVELDPIWEFSKDLFQNLSNVMEKYGVNGKFEDNVIDSKYSKKNSQNKNNLPKGNSKGHRMEQ